MKYLTLDEILNSTCGLNRQLAVADKYKFTMEQINKQSDYCAGVFLREENISELPQKLPVLLGIKKEDEENFIKDIIRERFLVADSFFDEWPSKYLISHGEDPANISSKFIELKTEMTKELQPSDGNEIGEELKASDNVDINDNFDQNNTRMLILEVFRDHLKELLNSQGDQDIINEVQGSLMFYISHDASNSDKNIAEIVKVLDENKLVIGSNNLPVAGENVMPTVASWLALFRSKIGAGNWTDTLAIPKFLAGHEAGLLPPAEKIFLGRVLEFYRRLKGYPDTLASLQEPDLGFIPALNEVVSSEHLVVRKPQIPIQSASSSVIPTKVEGSLGSGTLSSPSARDDKSVQPLPPTTYKPPAQSFAKQNLGGLQPSTMSDIKPKSEIATPSARNDSGVTNSLLNADEEAELSSHKLSSPNSKFQIPNSEADLEKLVNEASAKNGVKFRDEAMQKRFTTAAVMFLKGIRDEMEIREIILKDENLGGLGAPSAIVEPVIKMLKNLKSNLEPRTQNLKPTEELVVPRNFDIKNPLKQMLDAEATAAATILPKPEKKVVSSEYLVLRKPQNNTPPNAAPIKPVQNESLPTNYSQLPTPSAKPPEPVLSVVEGVRNDKVTHTQPLPPTTYHLQPKMSDVTKPHPLMGGVEEMQYLSLADFRSLGATIEQRVARLSEKFALIKKESLAKFVSAIKAYRASPLFQQYVTLGANSLGQSKTIIQEIAGDTGAGNFLTMEEFDALADFHGSLAY